MLTFNKKLLISIILIIFISTIVSARILTIDYNNPLTRSIADKLYCIVNSDCSLYNLIVYGDLTVIGNITNQTIINQTIIVNVTQLVDENFWNNTGEENIIGNYTGDFTINTTEQIRAGQFCNATHCFTVADFMNHTGTGGGSDNLGNHIATQNLNLSGYNVTGTKHYKDINNTLKITFEDNGDIIFWADTV